jgi:diguanylate cyclase (GGDEF)-like protein/PAS domain S-box-containing protein
MSGFRQARDASSAAPTGQPASEILVTRDHPELLRRLPAVVYIADVGPTARWHYVSPQIETILGFTTEEWLGDPELWLNRLHPGDRDWVLASEAEHSAGEGHPTAMEYRILHRDGRLVWIRDDATLVQLEDGSLRWHGVLSDVTERKSVEAELERRAAQQAAVAKFGEHALEGATTSELMQRAVTVAAETLDADLVGVAELLPDRSGFAVRAGSGWPDPDVTEVRLPGGGASQAGFAVLSGAPVVVEDWAQPQPFAQSPAIRRMNIRSGIVVVIEGSRGPFGILGAHSARAREYAAGDVDFLQSLANVLADALERQAIEDDIRHRALHDSLTGLPNRALFLDRLDHTLAALRRRGGLAAILFLDLDHFKLVNDSLGHHVGDELLTAAAPRLKQAVRASDTVARFGGDEFGILLEAIADESDAIQMAERVAAAFSRPFVLNGNEHFVSASVGIALARGGELAAELIRDADAAMYRAKERGRARYELFDEVMRGRAIARLRVENDLRRALERDELRLEYQPIVSLADGTVRSVESLLRWEHPERGRVMPSEFLPIAEANGLIEPIGRWVLDQACRQAGSWYRSRPDEPPVGISVNLSTLQITRTELPELVLRSLQASGLDPSCLSLEISESTMLGDFDTLRDALKALKALGVRLVLDDFGVGYSSLSHLTRLPVDAIKVDRSFVDGLGTDGRATAITDAIIAMARALSLEVVAAGVETHDQVEALLALGCPLAQGYHFSRPLPAASVSEMLRRGPLLPAT